MDLSETTAREGTNVGAVPPVSELLAALDTVHANLERRVDRAYGAILVLWGVVTAAIFAFYQIHELFPDRLRGFSHDAWLLFTMVGLLATGLVGARFDRSSKTRPSLYPFWHMMVFITLGVFVVVALLSLDAARRIPGFWVLYLPVLLLRERSGGPRSGRTLLIASGAIVSGLFLLVWEPWWSWTAGAVLFSGSLLALGVRGMRNA